MNNAIGDCNQFKSVGVAKCQVNNSHVGKNVRDSILSSMVFASPFPAANNTPGAIGVGYYRSPNYGENITNMEVAFGSVAPNGNAILVQLTHLRHSGSGEMKLSSNNTNYFPLFNFNLYTNNSEVYEFVDQFKKVRYTMASLALQGIFYFEVSPGTQRVPANATDDEIATYLTSVINPEGHYVGTCSLNKVVDGHGRLLTGNGNVVPGLYIADNSILSQLLNTHATCSSAMLIGAVVSRHIAKDFNLQKA